MSALQLLTNVPVYFPPTSVPVYSPPVPDYDEPEMETCEPLEYAGTCGLHSPCSHVCVPKFCKIRENPHKIHDAPYTDDDTYDKFGDVVLMTNRSWHGSGPRLHIYSNHFNWTSC
jgi:hypothetical protein|mmetsp:Transcript_9712/g.17680  ORF Transcript_9712/g.17680 Transcript_9712/m.17680 type:complete len:115 (+) Transcript_9712:572-916(+)